MSVQAISWALSVVTGSPSAKCVLLCIANYADDRGRCWPSQATIAKQTEQSVDSVQRRVNELEACGLLSRTERPDQTGKPGGRYYYQLSMVKGENDLSLGTTPQSAAMPESTPQNGEKHTAKDEKAHRTVAVQTAILKPSYKTLEDGLGFKEKKWVQTDSPEWSSYAERYKKKLGVNPRIDFRANREGAWFPSSW